MSAQPNQLHNNNMQLISISSQQTYQYNYKYMPLVTQSKSSRVNYSSIYDHGHARHSIYFRNRPSTTHNNRNFSSQRFRSIDSYHKKSEHSEIDFKRDRFPYETKYNPLSQEKSQHQQRVSVHHIQPENIVRPTFKMDNLKTSLTKYQNLMDSNNDVMKNIVKEQILSELTLNDPTMRKIDKHLVQSLIMIGKIKRYEQEELISKIDGSIGFVLYGRLKIFNQDYKNIVQRGDIVGENLVFNFSIALKARCLEESCIYWLPYKFYLILRQESIRNGLKKEFNQLEIALRLSYIKKKYDAHLKKTHL